MKRRQSFLQHKKTKAAAVLAAVLSVLLLSGCQIHIWIDREAEAPARPVIWQEDGTYPSDFGSGDSSVYEYEDIVVSLDSGEIVIPAYEGNVCQVVNGNKPFFTEADWTAEAFESYSELDELGRCGVAFACIGEELMPAKEREDISSVKPTGWQTARYDVVEGEALYNRSHLIGYQLTAENANERNLITGTRYLNAQGMEPFESRTACYIKSTGNHVLYRVTPVFTGDHLLADGVLMEARSVEDEGAGIEFCVFIYNVQPGVGIDYRTGASWLLEQEQTEAEAPTVTYVLNTRSMKFHWPACDSVSAMSEHNKQEYTGTREDLIAQGYTPCKNCNP